MVVNFSNANYIYPSPLLIPPSYISLPLSMFEAWLMAPSGHSSVTILTLPHTALSPFSISQHRSLSFISAPEAKATYLEL